MGLDLRPVQLSGQTAGSGMENSQLVNILLNQARIMNALFDGANLDGHRYKIFSQWDEDGILQYITKVLKVSPFFVEIGVGDYTECNTRLLNEKDGWTGVVVEKDEACCRAITERHDFWARGITVCNRAVTAENVNSILQLYCTSEVGLLSVDIDGVDFWVWRAVEVIRPPIVVVEYNPVFGGDVSVTVPYDPDFDRGQEHYSYLYAGASLLAMIRLGGAKGYAFVGANSGSNNAFFIRTDLVCDELPERVGAGVYHEPQFRESRAADGRLTYLSNHDARELIRMMPVVETITGNTMSLGQAIRAASHSISESEAIAQSET
ncbi:hypothetical protein N185_08520 [Sinorhizobium sp. GW3]|nr:hypothetical protein N185_08520 [Sinorhizobium sp. GW3]